MPYTKAKEKFFPERGGRHPRRRGAARGDPRPAQGAAGRHDGTADRPLLTSVAVVRRHLRAQPGVARRPSAAATPRQVALVGGRLGQHVAEDRGEAPLALPRRSRPGRGARSCAQPRCGASSAASASLARRSPSGDDGDGSPSPTATRRPVGLVARARRRPRSRRRSAAGVSGSSFLIRSQTSLGRGQPPDRGWGRRARSRTGSVENWILSSPMSLNWLPSLASFLRLPRPSSTVSDLVAASRKSKSVIGLASVPAETTLLAIDGHERLLALEPADVGAVADGVPLRARSSAPPCR